MCTSIWISLCMARGVIFRYRSRRKSMASNRHEMSPVLKEHFVRLHKEGRNNYEIAKITGYDRSTVSKFLKRFAVRQSVANNARSERPKLTSDQSDRVLNWLVLKNRRKSLSDLTLELNKSIS